MNPVRYLLSSSFGISVVTNLTFFFLVLEILDFFKYPIAEDISVWNEGRGVWVLVGVSIFLSLLYGFFFNWNTWASDLVSLWRDARQANSMGSFFALLVALLALNTPYQSLIAVTPTLVVAAMIFVGFIVGISSWEVPMVLAIPVLTLVVLLWSVSGVVAAVWFQNHREKWVVRVRILLAAMNKQDAFIHSEVVKQFHTAGTSKPEKDRVIEEIRVAIRDVLFVLCQVIAYRLDSGLKTASFLLYNEPPSEAHFEVFDEYPGSPHSMNSKMPLLKRESSLAGLSLDEDQLVVMKDCRKEDPTGRLRWQDIGESNGMTFHYIGRAAVPVKIHTVKPPQEVGVLCFGIAVPWELTPEEREVMSSSAERIAGLWILRQALIDNAE